jgi:hypothetical protein
MHRYTFSIVFLILALLVVGADAAFGEMDWFVGGIPLGGKAIKGTVETFSIHDESPKFTISCSGVDNNASIGPKRGSLFTIKLTSCSVVGHEECVVTEPIEAKLQGQIVQAGPKEESSKVVDIIYPQEADNYENGTWASIVISKGKSTCPFEATYTLKGSQVAKLRASETEELGSKEIEKVKIWTNKPREDLAAEYFNNETGKAEKAGELAIVAPAWIESGVEQELESHEHYGAP